MKLAVRAAVDGGSKEKKTINKLQIALVNREGGRERERKPKVFKTMIGMEYLGQGNL